MPNIIIKTQAELDALPDSFDQYTIIELHGGTPFDRLVVKKAWESSHVVARGSSHVVAWGSSHVVAWESSHVTNLGTIKVSPATSELLICHVFGQVEAGAGTNMHAVEMALKIARLMRFQGPVYAPYKMGCGIGGGDWGAYSKLLQTYFPDLIIVRRPQDMGEEAVQVETEAGSHDLGHRSLAGDRFSPDGHLNERINPRITP